MPNTPALSPTVYQANPAPVLVAMHYDGSRASFEAVVDWLTETFPGENMISRDDPDDNWFSLGSPRLVDHCSRYTGTGEPWHIIMPNDWIWISEELLIDSGNLEPVAVTEYVPVTGLG